MSKARAVSLVGTTDDGCGMGVIASAMQTIATLTMNPAIDVSYEVDEVFHTRKMRARSAHYDPGGGGINVARVIARLGGAARAVYLSGGATGAALDGLLDRHQLLRTRLSIAGDTRMSTAVLEHSSGKEYRFVPPGPDVAEAEWQAVLARLESVECDWLVASGSLPKGVPEDFYSRVSALMARRGGRLVLDTSGPALKAGLAGGGVFLMKPSHGELQQLVGLELPTNDAIGAAASAIVADGRAEAVAVTMGSRGALLAWSGGTLFLPAVPVEAKSAVGAGDSFLAAMVFMLANGGDMLQAFRHGIAGGTAAVLTPGTDLCHAADIERMLALVALP